uniref:Uncharacterized protein n=1 Tax=viral metagenome TaxID=1070528 RepID=A0A6C0EJZ7_9ZZZZ
MSTDQKICLIKDDDTTTYCFILWKLYNQIVSGDTRNPYTGKPFLDKDIRKLFTMYSNLGPWEKLRHEQQPFYKTRGLSPPVVMGLKLMQFGVVARPPDDFGVGPFLLIGTIPSVPKNLEGLLAARLGINADIIVSPRKIDTVVNLRDYKGRVIACNIWDEDCKLPDVMWSGVYFNHIPPVSRERVTLVLSRLITRVAKGGFLIYQTDIKAGLEEGEKLKRFMKSISERLNAVSGLARWNDGIYGWLVMRSN